MEQTLGEAEFIFVDDCSPDGSMAVLERVLSDYPQRQGQVRIFHHQENRGLPAARNTGLAAATGEYIFHCDSDDYMERHALESMYQAAIRQDADIVYTDWYFDTPSSAAGRTRCMHCPAYSTAHEALLGMLHGTMKYNVWNKLVRRRLYRDTAIRFPEGHSMGEDMTMILLFAKAQRIAYLPKATYHYVRQNENAFTATRRTATEGFYDDLFYNAQRIITALEGTVPAVDLACFKLNVKYPFLISTHREDYERWQQWFPEANKFIHCHRVSRRARLLEQCASRHLFLPLRLHCHLLQRLQG